MMIGHMSDTHLGWYHTGERLVEREEASKPFAATEELMRL